MKLCLHGLVYLGWIMDYVPFLIFLLYLYMYLLCDNKRFWTWFWTSGPAQVSGGSSSRKHAESGSVSKASNTRPSASSFQHHRHHQSLGDRRSLSSASSQAYPDRKSPSSHHERRRESADRTGHSYVVRRDVRLSPKVVKPSEKRTITSLIARLKSILLFIRQPLVNTLSVCSLRFGKKHAIPMTNVATPNNMIKQPTKHHSNKFISSLRTS